MGYRDFIVILGLRTLGPRVRRSRAYRVEGLIKFSAFDLRLRLCYSCICGELSALGFGPDVNDIGA